MKKIFLLAVAAIVVCSCGVATHERYVTKMFLDFQPYSEAGFFISPDSYTGKFSPIGEMNITVQPAVQPQTQRSRGKKLFEDAVYFEVNGAPVAVEVITAEELVEMAVKEARARGANGISNFKCTRVLDADTVEKYHYEISGFAIRID